MPTFCLNSWKLEFRDLMQNKSYSDTQLMSQNVRRWRMRGRDNLLAAACRRRVHLPPPQPSVARAHLNAKLVNILP